MKFHIARRPLTIAACAIVIAIVAITSVLAQTSPGFFTLVDANKDGIIDRAELKAAMQRWISAGDTAKSGAVTQAQLAAGLDTVFSDAAFMVMLIPPGPQNQTPKEADVTRMLAALPTTAPATPLHPRKVLVLSKCAGYVHACIPLAAKTIESLGSKTGAWTTTVSYDSASITADNLKQYDLVFLNNTTGAFLDDPGNPAVTAARRKALLDFVRSGKGLAGIHAAGDSYHEATGGYGWGGMLAPIVMAASGKTSDAKITADDLNTLADKWFDQMDTAKSGKLTPSQLVSGFRTIVFTGRRPNSGARTGRDGQSGTWPEFNRTIGGFFKYHWSDGQHIVYKIDDPASPLTAMFRAAAPFELDDETYTFGVKTWSRQNLHILTSIDYSKMSDTDKAKEDFPREDHDYGLSWIHREGKGRVFYEAHGHNEKIYANKTMLEHLLAGVQYALGDLKADDTPSAKKH